MTGKPGVLQSMGLQRVGYDLVTEQQRRERQPTLVFLPGEFHGQKNLVGYSLWGRKELDTTERLHSLTHENVLLICYVNSKK